MSSSVDSSFRQNSSSSNCANSSENTAYGLDFHNIAVFTNGLILYPLFCIPGLVANIITVLVLSRKSLRSSTNFYLTALAVSDSIKLLADLVYPTILIVIQINKGRGEYLYAHIYPYGHFVLNFSVCISSWLVVSVAVERYIMVCHPIKAKRLCSMRKARVITTVVYVSMMSVAFPTAFRYRSVQSFDNCTGQFHWTVSVTHLWNSSSFSLAYTWCQNLLRSIIPLIILAVLNTFIVHSVKKTRNCKRIASRNKITVMLIAVTLLFLITCTPDAIMSTALGFGYVESESYIVKGVREFTDCLLTINSAVNFVIYCAMSKDFRREFLHMFCRQLAVYQCNLKSNSHTSNMYHEEIETFKMEMSESKNITSAISNRYHIDSDN